MPVNFAFCDRWFYAAYISGWSYFRGSQQKTILRSFVGQRWYYLVYTRLGKLPLSTNSNYLRKK